jgi:hypothetical protein
VKLEKTFLVRMLNQFSVQLLPGMARIADTHRLAGQQHDNLCGAYWAAIFLRSRGFSHRPEQVAQLAGTVLPVGDPLACIPKGATPRQDYHLSLPITEQNDQAGTSVGGLMAAIEQLSAGAYCLIPIQAEWSTDRINAIMAVCENEDWHLMPLCNLRTNHLWGGQLSVSQAIAYLNGETVHPPAADWQVGHFLVLAGTVIGKERSLMLVCDTYPSLGWQGYHLQPAAAIAQALNRGDGYQGGILLFTSKQNKTAIGQELQAQRFTIEPWDNGSPDP